MGSAISCENNSIGMDPVAKSTLAPCQRAKSLMTSGQGPSESLEKITMINNQISRDLNAFEKKELIPLNVPLVGSLLLNPYCHLLHPNSRSSIDDTIKPPNSNVSFITFGSQKSKGQANPVSYSNLPNN
jgi:hypothetical protein